MIALYSLVEEHHSAILGLFKLGAYDGSALALIRPVIDAALRAHWTYSVATPDHLSKIRVNKATYPNDINRIAAEIDKKMKTGGIFSAIKTYVPTMHAYTHGGFEQLVYRFDENGDIRPNYPHLVKVRAIVAVTGYFAGVAIALLQMQSENPEDDPRAKAISDLYVSMYGAVTIL